MYKSGTIHNINGMSSNKDAMRFCKVWSAIQKSYHCQFNVSSKEIRNLRICASSPGAPVRLTGGHSSAEYSPEPPGLGAPFRRDR